MNEIKICGKCQKRKASGECSFAGRIVTYPNKACEAYEPVEGMSPSKDKVIQRMDNIGGMSRKATPAKKATIEAETKKVKELSPDLIQKIINDKKNGLNNIEVAEKYQVNESIVLRKYHQYLLTAKGNDGVDLELSIFTLFLKLDYVGKKRVLNYLNERG